MRILIIRHGIAEKTGADSGAQEDAPRELTAKGRRALRKSARGLRQVIHSIDLIATSPLIRASQTAEVIATAFSHVRVVQIAALAPHKPPTQLLEWINAHPPESVLAVVGHEPHLSTFASWMLTGLAESFIELKKGGAALIETPAPAAAGRAKLLWALKPSQLRRLQ